MIPLTGNTYWIIGRDDSCDIVLSDPRVSRKHAKLVLERDGIFTLTDLSSINGTFVNKKRLTAPLVLRHGDVILTGKTHLEFYCLDDSGKTDPTKTLHDADGKHNISFSDKHDSLPTLLFDGKAIPSAPNSGSVDIDDLTLLQRPTAIQGQHQFNKQPSIQAELSLPVQKKYALLVSLCDDGTGLKSLPEAVSNVEAMKQVLEHSEIGGFSKIQTLFNPNSTTLETALESLAINRLNDDLLFIYFCGYGTYDSAENLYLATRLPACNDRGKLFRSQALSVNTIQEILKRSSAGYQIIIFDLRRYGELVRQNTAEPKLLFDTPLDWPYRAVINGDGLNHPYFLAGTQLFPYSHYFVEGLATGIGDLNEDGSITLEEVHEYAKKKVQYTSPKAEPTLFGMTHVNQYSLCQSKVDDPKLVYRKAVEQVAETGVISLANASHLKVQREQLELTLRETEEIEAAVLKPHLEYQIKLQQYTHAFVLALREQSPISKEQRNQLSRLQQNLGLPQAEIERLETKLGCSTYKQPLVNVSKKDVSKKSLSILGLTKNYRNISQRLLYGLIGGTICAFVLTLIFTKSSKSSLSQISNVPQGIFKYTGSSAFSSLRSPAVLAIFQQSQPNFQLRYVAPIDRTSDSGNGIRMLLNGELSFAQSSRPPELNELKQAEHQGFKLQAIPVAIDGIAIAVNPSLNLSGLTVRQLQQIYAGEVTNWQQIGGPNQLITPYYRRYQDMGAVEFLPKLNDRSLGRNVKLTSSTNQALKLVAADLGGMYVGSASEVVNQCTVKSLPIGLTPGSWVPVYQPPLVPLSSCPEQRNQLNLLALKRREYPLTRRLFIVVKRDGGLDEKAGLAYANLLLSDQGQALIKQSGLVPIHK